MILYNQFILFNCGADNKTMKNIVILFAGKKIGHGFEKVFDSKSAFERCIEWAKSVKNSLGIVVLCNGENKPLIDSLVDKDIKVIVKENWTNSLLSSTVAEVCLAEKADYILYSWADCPFINSELTEEIIENHTKYLAEYTFADGFPYGVVPEAINVGTLNIISGLAKDTQKHVGDKAVERDCFFSIMSGEINSFEIETVIADKDYRMLRYEFECSSKKGIISCSRLYELALNNQINLANGNSYDVYKLFDLAEKSSLVMQTVPTFYNIQITDKYNTNSIYNPYPIVCKDKTYGDMEIEKFRTLLQQIVDYSESAVISLSCFGEPTCNKYFYEFIQEILKYPELSVLIETDGISLSEEWVSKIEKSGQNRIYWIVLLDSVNKEMYSKINGIDEVCYTKAVNSIQMLEKYFPSNVYPQFTRTLENESQLEEFYRFWSNKDSPSKGELIIQKYDSFCGRLPALKSADLSPLERNPCWHLRRDMVILSDGSVPICKDRIDLIVGNVFNENIETVWSKFRNYLEEHININYCAECKVCDEYYTFNF